MKYEAKRKNLENIWEQTEWPKVDYQEKNLQMM